MRTIRNFAADVTWALSARWATRPTSQPRCFKTLRFIYWRGPTRADIHPHLRDRPSNVSRPKRCLKPVVRNGSCAIRGGF